ncbi:hypothetical protein HMI56_001536 [Coelomomyces lativittatus]|nr:hypothetical protein HMI56_001536 [Coelomomyces lativittatus]
MDKNISITSTNSESLKKYQELNVLCSELSSLPSDRAVYQLKVRNSNVLYPATYSTLQSQVKERLEALTANAPTTQFKPS